MFDDVRKHVQKNTRFLLRFLAGDLKRKMAAVALANARITKEDALEAAKSVEDVVNTMPLKTTGFATLAIVVTVSEPRVLKKEDGTQGAPMSGRILLSGAGGQLIEINVWEDSFAKSHVQVDEAKKAVMKFFRAWKVGATYAIFDAIILAAKAE
jgi:hypothetical protein